MSVIANDYLNELQQSADEVRLLVACVKAQPDLFPYLVDHVPHLERVCDAVGADTGADEPSVEERALAHAAREVSPRMWDVIMSLRHAQARFREADRERLFEETDEHKVGETCPVIAEMIRVGTEKYERLG